MFNPIDSGRLPVVIEPPELLAQGKGQEGLNTDFAGAVQCTASVLDEKDLADMEGGPPFASQPWDRGAPRTAQTRQSIQDDVWYPWDHDCYRNERPGMSSPTQRTQVHATVDVFANVPVRIQLVPPESPALRQGSSRRIPADYSQHVVTGGDHGRHPVAATRYDLADYGAAPPREDHIDEPTQKFLSDWSKAITEGEEPCNQLFTGIIEKSVAAAEERVHAALEKALIMMLGKLAEHLRMPTLKKLLTQPKDSTLDLVEKHLPDIGKVIPEKDKKALTDLLESVGIKWPKVFG